MIDQQQARVAEDLEELEQVDAYVEWQKREGVPVIHDFVFEDLNALELGDWPRKSGRGAIINIPNPYLPNDAHVVEIRAGSQSAPERHMYEEMVLILSGRGSTSVWLDEKRKQTFEWGDGSLFSILDAKRRLELIALIDEEGRFDFAAADHAWGGDE